MSKAELAEIYRAYIACLNDRDWSSLDRFVADEARHNGRPFGLAGYRAMLEQDCRDIPDLYFEVALLVVEPPHVASRLAFNVTPRGAFLGLPVNGRRVEFTENVFYCFESGKIIDVLSVIDKRAIERQLGG